MDCIHCQAQKIRLFYGEVVIVRVRDFGDLVELSNGVEQNVKAEGAYGLLRLCPLFS